jgi:hypothetical protein
MAASRLNTADIPIRELANVSTNRKFDIRILPADLQRLYKNLKASHDEDYALLTVFTIRTAVALHRAWHMTLLTSKILQQLKDRYRLRMTWNLGVFKLQFRCSDGQADLFRRVPYDYDSEYQDIFMRVAIALMDDEITIHEALIYQWETEQGVHTARASLFLRDFPGRLVLYPLVSATCAVIFFSGDWTDFGIAALCGLAAGLVECLMGWWGFAILTDACVGASTGLIGGLFYRFGGESVCLSSIFLGTLYWFFYGTAFVLGILEIIAGELETGVTRFIAVAVKTFVLCLGAGFGMLVVGNATEVWYEQANNCGRINLEDEWWRIPLYLLCSVAVLGQYRMPINRYWRALVTMLVGYEVQYQCFNAFATFGGRDNLDTAISNVLGCASAVVSACMVSHFMNRIFYYKDARILRPDHPDNNTSKSKFIYALLSCGVRVEHMLGLARESDVRRLDMERKLQNDRRELRDASHPRQHINLDPAEENLIIETIVGTQDMNIWYVIVLLLIIIIIVLFARYKYCVLIRFFLFDTVCLFLNFRRSVLMPALYQLVPGSLIAKLWFNYIFPPKVEEVTVPIEGAPGLNYTIAEFDDQANNVFGGLMIVSTSLALGLIVGFAVVEIWEDVLGIFPCFRESQSKLKNDEKLRRAKDRRIGMYSAPVSKDENPASVAEELKKAILHGISTEAEVDAIFNAIDIDCSGAIDEDEVTYFMTKAGLGEDQVKQLFAKMDKDGDGEVSRKEFGHAILDRSNASLLTLSNPDAEIEESPVVFKEDSSDTENASAKADTENASAKASS